MGKELIQVYPADAILITDERKQLYKDILEYVEIGELGRGFSKALKVLCFEGKVESLDTMVRNDDGFFTSGQFAWRSFRGLYLPGIACGE